MINTPIISTSKNKYTICFAFLLCLAGAFIMYELSCIIREIFRIFSIDWYYSTFIILSEREQFFFNFFYACFSCIIAFNVFLLYLFNSPRQFRQRKRYLQLASVHNLRFTAWLFIFYFGSIFIDLWSFFGLGLKGRPSQVNLVDDYWYLFAFILMVLFFNSYSSLRRILPKRSFQQLAYTALGILLVALSFTQIKLTDYKKLEQKFASSNIYNQHKYIQLNASTSYSIENMSWSIPLFIIKDAQNGAIKIYNKYHTHPIENLATYLKDAVATKYSKRELALLVPNLHFNADLTMGEFTEIYKQIKESLGSGKVDYALKAGIRNMQIFKDNLSGIFELELPIENNLSIIEIEQKTKGKFLINGVPGSIDELKTKLLNLTTAIENPVIHFTINKNGSFTDYFAVKSIIKEIDKTFVDFQSIKVVPVPAPFSKYPKQENKPKASKKIKVYHQLN